MGQPVVHWELMSKEPGRVADFYAKIFGWKVQHMPQINYRLVQTGAKLGINGGIVQPDREAPWPGNQIFYVAVDDLAAYCRKIESAGGQIHVRSQEVPGMGWLALFTDPEGRMNGLWKPKTPTRRGASRGGKGTRASHRGASARPARRGRAGGSRSGR
jgi:predicted enzyme related to lactoylglutathione lyase